MPPKFASVVESKYEPGAWFVEGVQWKLPYYFRLERKLGAGSFSQVCLALDSRSPGHLVAIKRIGDVVSSPFSARHVVRELLLLRLDIPGVIHLEDAFLQPASTGPCHLVDGRLVPSGADLYLVLEYLPGGDLLSLEGTLSAQEVRQVLWQLLEALEHLHDAGVWHRDVKSANCLVRRDARGNIHAKICDLGSARIATTNARSEPSISTATASTGTRETVATAAPRPPPPPPPLSPGIPPAGRDVVLPRAATTSAYGFTPCYRAPEVSISGRLSAAIDLWSLGCIFAELLQRIPAPGASPLPRLQVAPLFGELDLDGATPPRDGDRFESSRGNPLTHAELDALFREIGTPSWAQVRRLPDPHWRAYLRGIRGRPNRLHVRFAHAGEDAVDLLSRLLAFDPDERCSAREAMRHEYFSPLCLDEAIETEEGVEVDEGVEAEEGVESIPHGADSPMETPAAAVGEKRRRLGEPARRAEGEDIVSLLLALDAATREAEELPPDEARRAMLALLSQQVEAVRAARAAGRVPIREDGEDSPRAPRERPSFELQRGIGQLELEQPGTGSPLAGKGRAEGQLVAGRHGEWPLEAPWARAALPTSDWGVRSMPPEASDGTGKDFVNTIALQQSR